MIAKFQVCIPVNEFLKLMSKYAKLLKEFLSGKNKEKEGEHVDAPDKCNPILYISISPKQKDPCKFTIPCNIGEFKFPQA